MEHDEVKKSRPRGHVYHVHAEAVGLVSNRVVHKIEIRDNKETTVAVGACAEKCNPPSGNPGYGPGNGTKLSVVWNEAWRMGRKYHMINYVFCYTLFVSTT